jgi:glycosyltransferase involved in cell wall biosynthesis
VNTVISIITVVYNGELYLERTIKSVASQKSNAIEYIIIDGGSTDTSNDIVSKYRDSVDLHISEKDDGIFDAMNKGSRLANGEYLWFINSDDYLCDGIVESILCYLKSSDTNPDVIYGDILSLSYNGQFYNCPTPSRISKELFYNLPIHHPGSLVLKSTFLNADQFDVRYKLSSDFDLFYRLINNNRLFVKLEGKFATMQEGGTGTQHIIKSLNEFYKSLRSNKCKNAAVYVKFFARYGFLLLKYKTGPISKCITLMHNAYRKFHYGE